MQTIHKFLYKNANNVPEVESESVDLIVTSPPYPMIQMWDELFISIEPTIKDNLESGNGKEVFETMHRILDYIWWEMDRILKPGGIICVNAGDAVRTLKGSFSLYPNHSRIITSMHEMGYYSLPEILWKKQFNAPNKYMGSAMLPVGAYVTLEHEHILIFRKGTQRRLFKTEEQKKIRRESAFFWPERNEWFSDVWTGIKGIKQKLDDVDVREKSAAFPFMLAYRLINMFSVKGDTVVDPFLGTGTTSLAAAVAGRNSIGIEIELEFKTLIDKRLNNVALLSASVIRNRLEEYVEFVSERERNGKEFKYFNNIYKLPVVSRYETDIFFNKIENITQDCSSFIIDYESTPGD